MTAGAGVRKVAEAADIPHATVRSWRRRIEERAEILTARFCAVAVALGSLAPRLASGALPAMIAALAGAAAAAVRRLGASGSV